MKYIKEIDGLTVEGKGKDRVVRYLGATCPLIERRENLCEQDTSYNGEVLDSWETYQTPVGVVERSYWARGPGLERQGVDWRLVPVSEIDAIQARFVAASKEMAAAREALEMYTLRQAQAVRA